ncbi:hypothetical protein ACFL5N_02750, partial [bacterium]
GAESYCSTYKSDIDRGAVMKAIKYYLYLVKIGKDKDRESLQKFRTILHAGSVMAGSKAVEEGIRPRIIEIVKLIEGLDALSKQKIKEYQLPSLDRVKQEITIPKPEYNQEITPTKYLAVTKDEKQQRAFLLNVGQKVISFTPDELAGGMITGNTLNNYKTKRVEIVNDINIAGNIVKAQIFPNTVSKFLKMDRLKIRERLLQIDLNNVIMSYKYDFLNKVVYNDEWKEVKDIIQKLSKNSKKLKDIFYGAQVQDIWNELIRNNYINKDKVFQPAWFRLKKLEDMNFNMNLKRRSNDEITKDFIQSLNKFSIEYLKDLSIDVEPFW